MSSPWAMLITPIRPNTMARPSAIRTRMVNRLRPLKACIRKISKVIAPLILRYQHALPAPRPACCTGCGVRWHAFGGSSDLREGVRLDQRRLVDHVDLAVL